MDDKVKRKKAKVDEFEELMFGDLNAEERKLLKTPRDKYKVVQAQIDRLTIQEMRTIGLLREAQATGADDKDALKELASVQKLKAQTVKLLHDMGIDDVRYGLVENAEVEQAKKSAREVLEALCGEVVERSETECSETECSETECSETECSATECGEVGLEI